ncbi:MAG TPA: (Fe-S)-binding protein [Casimicrobiaceae bacterium]|nr:(Fe-S)-binding protein [Casimicrobiaceae bacterium]
MRVGLFVTCLVDLMRPSIGFAAVRLLEAGGAEVHVPPDQTCCGQPCYNGGDRVGARTLAARVLDQFEACDYLVAPSGSCSGMIRTHYADVFRDDPAQLRRAEALAARTYELASFLADVLKLDAVPGALAATATYHDCCAGLREMGVKRQPRALLSKVRGLELREMADCETCCGFGGTFSVKFGEISARLADNKCREIAASGADTVVLGDLGCMLNIEGRLRRRGDAKTRVLHVAEVLAGEAGTSRG